MILANDSCYEVTHGLVSPSLWSKERLQRAQLWLAAGQELNNALSVPPDLTTLIFMNIPFFGDPNSPEDLAKYKEKIQENMDLRRARTTYATCKIITASYTPTLENYLVFAYSAEPADLLELKQNFIEYGVSLPVQQDILNRIAASQPSAGCDTGVK